MPLVLAESINGLRRFYQIQVSRVFNRLALLPLPIATLSERRLYLRRPLVNGLGLYHRPLLVSYPRSGTNWVRYIVECISGCPTPGEERLVSGDNYFLDRAHRAYPVMKLYKKVLLIVRDYRECILRHKQDVWSDYPDVVALLTDETHEHPPSWYIQNIQAFDAFKGEKVLIYYENLLKEPVEAITKLSAFLRLDPARTRSFLEDIETEFQNSVDAYTRLVHTSETALTKDISFHAKTKLNPDQVEQFDEFYFSRYPDIANRYLSLYDTRNQIP